MSLSFETVYRVMVDDPQLGPEPYFFGIAIGARPFRDKLPDRYGGSMSEGFEWIPNSPIWRSRREFLRIEDSDPNRIEASSTFARLDGLKATFIFEPLTLKLLGEVQEDVTDFDNLVKGMTDEDLQQFFAEGWLRPDWKKHGDVVDSPSFDIAAKALEVEDEDLDALLEKIKILQQLAETAGKASRLAHDQLIEAKAMPIGTIRYWKSKGWVEKTSDGWIPAKAPPGAENAVRGTVVAMNGQNFQREGDDWKPVEAEDDFLPGKWKEISIGLPANSKKEHWDDEKGTYKLERQMLHREIIDGLLSKVRTVNPETHTKHAVITMGVPAAGKSSAVGDAMDTSNYAHIDPDKAREQLPEFKAAVAQRAKDGGTIVAAETIDITDKALGEAIADGFNVLLEGVVASTNWYENELFPLLKKKGYKISLLMVHEPSADRAVERAERRGRQTGRFVPEGMIKNVHPKIPKNFIELSKKVDGFTAYLSGRPPTKMWSKNDGTEIVHEPVLHDQLLRSAATEWWEALLGSLLVEASDKPTEISWDDFLKAWENATEQEEVLLDTLPETHEDGVTIPIIPMDDADYGS